MGYIIHEKSQDEIKQMSESLWAKLVSEGLAYEEGKINYDAFTKLDTIDRLNDRKNLGKVIGTDTRTKVLDTACYPYSAIVYLLMKFGDKYYRGTGFIIKDKVVLTAAHNLYDEGLKKAADEINVISKIGGKDYVAKSTKLLYPAEYDGSDEKDWGLIMFEPESSLCGKLAYGKALDIQPKDFSKGLIAGYPGEVRGAKTKEMWEGKGEIKNDQISKGILYYTISTSGGNSGSPVMVGEQGKEIAVGIHVSGFDDKNVAKAIDDDVIAAISNFK